MDLLTYYLVAAGCGLIQFLSVISRSMLVNRLASLLNIGGIILVAILGLVYFEILEMLGGILTVFLVGMVFSAIFLKIFRKSHPQMQQEEQPAPSRVGMKKKKSKKRK